MKKKLLGKLGLSDMKDPFVVKKNNSYACIACEKFKLLDVSHYLAAGYSYDKFLESFQASVRKSFFPYQWFDSVSKLKDTALPPPDAFYSELKGVNSLGQDQKTIEENFKELQNIWQQEGMTKFEHFLRFYNIRDVEPLVEAVMKMMKFYIDRDIDLFKCSISAPGIARRMLYDVAKKQQVHFSLFDQQQESLYCDFKWNLTGGPSIIFNRHAEVGKTFIRGNPLKPCKRVVGVDANALYLWAIGQAQPTGRCIVRTAERKFRAEIRDKYTAQYDYLDWLAHSQGIHIQHKLNGKEFKIGPYFVDGYCSETMTVYEFNGESYFNF